MHRGFPALSTKQLSVVFHGIFPQPIEDMLMYKKSILAIALVGAVMTAQAGSVSIYGSVDAGADYLNVHEKVQATGAEAKNTFSSRFSTSSTKLASGHHSANRFGIKGIEDLEGGMKAGFVLEGGFDLLNGNQAAEGRLFDRQADVFIEGPFGHFAAGRFGALSSGDGTYGIFLSQADNFAGGWGRTLLPTFCPAQSPEMVKICSLMQVLWPSSAPSRPHCIWRKLLGLPKWICFHQNPLKRF